MAIVTPAEHGLAFMVVCYVVVGFASFLLNAFCLVAMTKARMTKKHSAYITICSLVVGDLIISLGMIISGIMRLTAALDRSKPLAQTECFAANIFFFFTIPFGTNNMLLIAAERLYIVTFPLHYKCHGPTFVKVGNVLNVVYSIGSVLCGFIGISRTKIVPVCNSATGSDPLYFKMINLVIRFTVTSFTVIAYVLVVLIYRKRRQVILEADSESSVELKVVSSVGSTKSARPKPLTKIPVDVQGTVMAICLSYIVLSVVGVIIITAVSPLVPEAAASAITVHIGGLMVGINCILNVFIFPLKNAEMKLAMKRLLYACYLWPCPCCIAEAT